MKFIGLRLDEHDANVTYTDGRKVRYYSSERDLQIKHHGYEDLTSWTHLIKRWNIKPSEVDAIGIVIDEDKHQYLNTNDTKIYESIDIGAFRDLEFTCPVFRIDHHLAHSLSIWPIGKSDVDLVFDGYGDDNIVHSVYRNLKREEFYRIEDCLSFGSLFTSIANKLDIKGNQFDLAGKLMALQSYGNVKPYVVNRLKEMSIMDFDLVWSQWRLEWEDHLDYVRSYHEVTENIFANYFSQYDGVISYTGGIAQNVVINTEIKKRVPNLIIPPHANDCGLSLGIVEFLRKCYDQQPFDSSGFPFWQDDKSPTEMPTKETIATTAELLANGKIVGWYQGQGEIGPRALGNRSILMDPSIPDGKDILNDKVKEREWYRPFGASVLEEEVSNYFDWIGKSEYMLYTMDVLEPDRFPAITHVDGTCRTQTVSPSLYHQLISKFKDLTGIPMVLNTSLNIGGKPIAGTPADAIDLLHASDMDALVIGNKIYE